MHPLLLLALAAVGQVAARGYSNGIRYERRALANETVSIYTNISTISATSTSSLTSPSSTLRTTLKINSTSSTSSSELQPTKPTSPSNTTSNGGDCAGLVTYYGSVPPTVYSTVTEGFDVTVTASNASVTVGETLITPPPACESTIMPLLDTFQPLVTIVVSSRLPPPSTTDLYPTTSLASTETSAALASTTHFAGGPQVLTSLVATASSRVGGPPPKFPNVPLPDEPPPEPQPEPEAPTEDWTVIASTVYATAPYTSTVIVTKKTPVVVISPPTSAPPVFQQPAPSAPNQNSNPSGSPKSPGGGNPPPPTIPSTAPKNNPPPAPSNGPNNGNPPSQAPPPRPGGAPGPGSGNPGPSLGNVIVSLIQTQPFAPVPTAGPQTTIANIPVVILPSVVVIGDSSIQIPKKSDEVVATVEGRVFTVRGSEIAAPNTVVAFAPLNGGQAQPAPTPTRQVTIAPDIIAEVAGSTVVIQGTTYRNGFGATPTTITVNGVPVGIGPHGLVLPSTTVTPDAITQAPMVVESAGGLTFSIDQSEVVIQGTTYRIGSGAPTITTEVDGQTLSIGPGGVGLKTTTLKPTLATAMSGSRGSEGAASTSSSLVQDSLATRSFMQRIGMKEMLGWTITCLAASWLFI